MVKLMPITSLFVIHTMIYFSSVTSRSKDLLLETLFSHSSSKGQIISPTLHQHLLHWSAAVNTSPSYLKNSFWISFAQCGSFKIFLSAGFYVKWILKIIKDCFNIFKGTQFTFLWIFAPLKYSQPLKLKKRYI